MSSIQKVRASFDDLFECFGAERVAEVMSVLIDLITEERMDNSRVTLHRVLNTYILHKREAQGDS